MTAGFLPGGRGAPGAAFPLKNFFRILQYSKGGQTNHNILYVASGEVESSWCGILK